MENRIKKSQLMISLLWVTATFALAGFGLAALVSTTTQVISANASTIATDAIETSDTIAPTSNNNNTITLSEKPFLVEHGRTVAANPINQTHMQISLA